MEFNVTKVSTDSFTYELINNVVICKDKILKNMTELHNGNLQFIVKKNIILL
mgnify:FL=1